MANVGDCKELNDYMKEKKSLQTLIDMLSSPGNIMFKDLELKSYDSGVSTRFYESAPFTAFHLQWVVKARVKNIDYRAGTPILGYQLCLKTYTDDTVTAHFFMVKGPSSDIKVATDLQKYKFTCDDTSSDCYELAVDADTDWSKLLANDKINLRLSISVTTL